MDKLYKSALTNLVPYKTDKGEWKLEALGVPFGGHLDGKDYDGEFFSPRTDFMMEVGDSRPVLYYHGLNAWGAEESRPEVIGKATLVRIDQKGLWFDILLDKSKTLAKRIWESAIKGIVKASSGAVGYLKRKVEHTGEILTWAIGELTLVDEGNGRMASNQLATVNLKAIFEEAEIDLPEELSEDAEPSGDIQEEDDKAEDEKPDEDDQSEKEEIPKEVLVALGAKYLEMLAGE